ncbi:sperm-associated antigen 5 [Clinocottus analis]|uniref:sperm-associated antigen 5 n=1 Tax=Clinocottus analis TaxID=304258 RepID=UPI0035C05491
MKRGLTAASRRSAFVYRICLKLVADRRWKLYKVSQHSRVMSSRKSSFSGEGLPPGIRVERTPLRSVQNEMLSTPLSRFNSKSRLCANDVKPTKADVPICNPEANLQSRSSTKVDQINDVEACGLGDVTFKSIICPGGEVEIPGFLVLAEESIVLPKDQAVINMHDITDTLISDSTPVQSCSDHNEHPYYNPERIEASLVDIDAARVCEISNATLSSGDLDDRQVTQDFSDFPDDYCGKKDVTWKSFVCDGGEVEVLDVTGLQDETIPLSKAQLVEPLQENSVNLTYLSDCSQLSQVEHADHPYFSSEDVVCAFTTTSETTKGCEKSSDGLSDVTFKSFNCTGGVIEISDGTTLADEAVPLPADQTATCGGSYNYGIDPSMFASDQDWKEGNDHLDHHYCKMENDPLGEPLSVGLDVEEKVKPMCLLGPDSQTGRQEGITCSSFSSAVSHVELAAGLSQKTSPLPDELAVICQPLDDNSAPTSVTWEHIEDDYSQLNSHVENKEVIVDTDPPDISTSSLPNTSLKALDDESVICQMQEMSHRTESSDSCHLATSAETPKPVEVHVEHVSQVQISSESKEEMDSALGLSGSQPVLCNSAETPQAENLPGVLKVLSECPSVASAFQFGFLSPVARRASLALLKAFRAPALDNYALEGEKSLLAPFNVDPAVLWAEQLESPMPRPLFNSTALGCKPQSEPVRDVVAEPCVVPDPEVEKPVLDIPLIPDGPLQQQLRQMAEFLFLASGKMAPAAVSAPVLPSAAVIVPSAKATSHSVCVGTTPVKWVDHSVNTSGQFERKRNIFVVDSCTLTDPLLWNLPPGSLECLPRQELEQRLRSSMIMVEALVQQLDASRVKGCPSAGSAPSDLREKLVQTDHSELSQTTMYRDLYLEALSRIGDLELNGSSLQNLIQRMQDTRGTMTSLSYDTDAALSTMKQVGAVVREDHQSLVLHYGQMKSVLEKTKETHTTLMQKVKDAFHQRDDMRIQMKDAFTAKEAAFSVMEQLRTHCTTEIIELERMLGSQQELSAALNQTYPEQVALNQAYTEILNSASDVLSTTMDEQSTLMKELRTVRALLLKTAPMLLQLNEKAASALRERDEHLAAKDQAEDEREQIEEEFKEANMNLQTATEQISDLNLQVTILTSEMGVLRQKLTEREEERGQLERKVTQLSATVSSTLASSTFLEQALADQSTKLQQSWKDIQITKDRANDLERSLGQSEQCVSEVSQALAQREEQLSQLQLLSQFQQTQIQQLQDVCTQLKGVRETNEFLQAENELAREQMAESERMVGVNLQGLRERNIQCEDLKGECGQLQLENRSLQEELETTRSRADATQLELGQKLTQAVTEITLLHHTLRGLTNGLQEALNDQRLICFQKSEPLKESQRRHPSSSFVDSIMVALTAEKAEDAVTDTATDIAPGSDSPGPQGENVFSATSAFTRIATVTPKKNLNSVEFNPGEDEQSSVAELLADLGSTVSELTSTVKLLQQRKDAQVEELRNTVSGLQVEQQAAINRHEAEVFELKHQLSSLSSLFEKGNQALQQRAQDEKTVTRLMAEIQETQEILNKHKIDSNASRKELVELRRSLHESKVETQFLHEELRKAGSQSANPALFMEEKIQLLREVERQKLSLQEAEQARVKLLDRAKRHQMIHLTNQQKSENELQMLNKILIKVRETLLSLPEVVKNSVQLQQLIEYIG